TTTGKQITPSIGHHDIVMTAAFTADENVLLTAGREGRICRWDIATMKETHPEHNQRFSFDIPPAFSADRRHVYVGTSPPVTALSDNWTWNPGKSSSASAGMSAGFGASLHTLREK